MRLSASSWLRPLSAGVINSSCWGRNDDGIDAHRAVVLVVFDSHLALGIGAEISHVYTLAADFGKGHHQRVAQRERQGYIERRLVGGVAEHHALVSGALLEGLVALNATVDVGTLLVHGKQHAARVAVEAQLAAGRSRFR